MVWLLLITTCEIPRAYGLFDLTRSNEFKVNNFLTFRDSTLGFEISYPEGWIHEMHPGGIVTFLGASEGNASIYPAGLVVKVQHLTKIISLNQITRVQMKNLTQNYPDFKLLKSIDSKLAGTNAHEISFTAIDNHKQKRKAMQIWTVNRETAYLITYKADPGAYSVYLPVIQKMVDSFKFTNH
jgi:hypothetical protein